MMAFIKKYSEANIYKKFTHHSDKKIMVSITVVGDKAEQQVGALPCCSVLLRALSDPNDRKRVRRQE